MEKIEINRKTFVDVISNKNSGFSLIQAPLINFVCPTDRLFTRGKKVGNELFYGDRLRWSAVNHYGFRCSSSQSSRRSILNRV